MRCLFCCTRRNPPFTGKKLREFFCDRVCRPVCVSLNRISVLGGNSYPAAYRLCHCSCGGRNSHRLRHTRLPRALRGRLELLEKLTARRCHIVHLHLSFHFSCTGTEADHHSPQTVPLVNGHELPLDG